MIDKFYKSYSESLSNTHSKIMEVAGQHHDQLSSAMSDIVHNYLDSKIERLTSLHDHLSSKDNEFKSDIMVAGIRSAIDNHKQLKQHLINKKHHDSTHKSALRKLAMGAMATFGIFSGVKASDIQTGQEPQQGSTSVQSVAVAAPAASSASAPPQTASLQLFLSNRPVPNDLSSREEERIESERRLEQLNLQVEAEEQLRLQEKARKRQEQSAPKVQYRGR